MRAILLAIGVLLGQAFDVASIKPSARDNPNSTFEYLPGGTLRVQNGTLQGLIESAYDIRDFQVLGGPSWLKADRYDVVARSASGERAVSRAAEMAAARLKLRTLLAARFALAVHHEMRELPQFTLMRDIGAAKLIADPAVSEDATGKSGIQSSCGHMIATRATMANMAYQLSRRLRRPVVDLTGLSGVYTFQLDWTSDVAPCADAAADGPSIFTALREQLGLKLESTKGLVDTLVVDRAERPSTD